MLLIVIKNRSDANGVNRIHCHYVEGTNSKKIWVKQVSNLTIRVGWPILINNGGQLAELFLYTWLI